MTGSAAQRGRGADQAGFTLIELMISLALFALISLAGIRMVESIAGISERTAGRADRLGELQRALFLVTADLEQAQALPRRDGDRIILLRASGAGPFPVAYSLRSNTLYRAAGGSEQALIGDVEAARWRFLTRDGWVDQLSDAEDAPRPRAVEVVLQLAARPNRRRGTIRRVIELPGE